LKAIFRSAVSTYLPCLYFFTCSFLLVARGRSDRSVAFGRQCLKVPFCPWKLSPSCGGVKKCLKIMKLVSNQENEKKANAPTKEIVALMLLLAIN
jgi:hypothetical protein